jgi:hypothetical protein
VIIYEVNLDVDAAIATEYRAWLAEHIAHMLDLPGFTGAQTYEVVDPAPASDRVIFSVHYQMRDQAALDAYMRDHATRMRADGIARFGERQRTSRRVLRVGAAFA